MCCDYEWIGFVTWWCQTKSEVLAAWVQAIGSVGAILVAILIAYHQKRNDLKEKATANRKLAMSAATNLESALSYQTILLDFTPAGDGVIGHPITTLNEALNFIQIQNRTKEALKDAVEKCHYFSDELCEQVVKLNIKVAAYDRSIEQIARINNSQSVDDFFKAITNTRLNLSATMDETRKMLISNLPK